MEWESRSRRCLKAANMGCFQPETFQPVGDGPQISDADAEKNEHHDANMGSICLDKSMWNRVDTHSCDLHGFECSKVFGWAAISLSSCMIDPGSHGFLLGRLGARFGC